MKYSVIIALLLLCSQGFSQNTYNFLLEVGKYNDQIDVVEDELNSPDKTMCLVLNLNGVDF